MIVLLKDGSYLTIFDDRTPHFFVMHDGITQLLDGVGKRIVSDIVEQGSNHQGLHAANGDSGEATIFAAL